MKWATRPGVHIDRAACEIAQTAAPEDYFTPRARRGGLLMPYEIAIAEFLDRFDPHPAQNRKPSFFQEAVGKSNQNRGEEAEGRTGREAQKGQEIRDWNNW